MLDTHARYSVCAGAYNGASFRSTERTPRLDDHGDDDPRRRQVARSLRCIGNVAPAYRTPASEGGRSSDETVGVATLVVVATVVVAADPTVATLTSSATAQRVRDARWPPVAGTVSRRRAKSRSSASGARSSSDSVSVRVKYIPLQRIVGSFLRSTKESLFRMVTASSSSTNETNDKKSAKVRKVRGMKDYEG